MGLCSTIESFENRSLFIWSKKG